MNIDSKLLDNSDLQLTQILLFGKTFLDVKGTVMQIEKALINDRLHVSKVP